MVAPICRLGSNDLVTASIQVGGGRERDTKRFVKKMGAGAKKASMRVSTQTCSKNIVLQVEGFNDGSECAIHSPHVMTCK